MTDNYRICLLLKFFERVICFATVGWCSPSPGTACIFLGSSGDICTMFSRVNQATEDDACMHAAEGAAAKAGQAFQADGKVGKQFNPDGAAGWLLPSFPLGAFKLKVVTQRAADTLQTIQDFLEDDALAGPSCKKAHRCLFAWALSSLKLSLQRAAHTIESCLEDQALAGLCILFLARLWRLLHGQAGPGWLLKARKLSSHSMRHKAKLRIAHSFIAACKAVLRPGSAHFVATADCLPL